MMSKYLYTRAAAILFNIFLKFGELWQWKEERRVYEGCLPFPPLYKVYVVPTSLVAHQISWSIKQNDQLLSSPFQPNQLQAYSQMTKYDGADEKNSDEFSDSS